MGTLMPGLSVPRPHRAPLERLCEVSTERSSELVDALKGLKPFTSIRELASQLRAVWPQLSEPQAHAMTLALLSLAAQRSPAGDADELGRLVSESADLAIPAQARERFATLLRDLVQLDVLKTTSRAIDVMTQQEHVFQGARVLTDIRPIFSEDAAVSPAGAVVIQTLRLEHFTDGGIRTINVSLDQEDLRELKMIVDRAVAKGETLRGVIERAGLAQFELEVDDGGA